MVDEVEVERVDDDIKHDVIDEVDDEDDEIDKTDVVFHDDYDVHDNDITDEHQLSFELDDDDELERYDKTEVHLCVVLNDEIESKQI